MTPTPPPDPLGARLRQGQRFLLTSHASPDGDAVGSELALARILEQWGKSVWIWNRDPAPGLYRALPGSARIHVGDAPPATLPAELDAIVALECPSLDRTGLARDLAGLAPLCNVDHHLGNEQYGEVNWVDTDAAAVGVLVFRLARVLGAPVDATTATLLLLTLVSDTGGFRFSNANVAAFETSADLVRAGADPTLVSRWLYESQPEAAIRLLGEMLGSLALHHGGRIASVELTQAMFAASGAGPSDSDGLIDTPRSIAGVEATLLLRELGAERWKISLRSRGPVDVERIARDFGGGGHKNAAGGMIDGPLASVRPLLLARLAAALGDRHA